ncbi:MAG: cyclic pyranopterin monophosphate synthase MoaC [Bacteroidia bacterium]|nr:cyclic pyranopterin monophosphate synthase MoaC [Bacteroidia bacterium]
MSKDSPLSHVDAQGKPSMVDVGPKLPGERYAHARSVVQLTEDIMALMQNNEIQTAKGAVFQTAIIAGTMGAKKTSELIPFCHPIGMDSCKIEIQVMEKHQVRIDCYVKVQAKTGVEMEALTGASIAALTIYDMCKAMSHEIMIRETKLMAKTGGKQDFHRSL